MPNHRTATHDPCDEKLLERVRALLAKAESTSFPQEAEALTAKAQELMTRHAIDQAMLAAGGTDPGAPGIRRITVTDPYADGKAMLCDRVAAANRCQAVQHRGEGCVSVVGFPGDLDATELLFTSLLVQASSELLAHGPQVDASGRSRTRSFRSSFWLGYAVRIGERLAAVTEATVTEATTEHGASVLPVLASRAAAVDDAFARAFPKVTTRRVGSSNPAGRHAGRAAANRADLGAAAVSTPSGTAGKPLAPLGSR